MMAQKTPPLLVGEVGESVFPFLDPTIVRLGFDEAERARGGSAGTGVGGTVARGVGGGAQPGPVQKAALKQLLARHVPEEMVYRPKSGPAPPIAAQLARPATQEAFEEVVLSAGSPLRPWLDLNVVRSLVRVPGSGRRLPHFAHNFLWTVLVTGLWLEGANAVRMRDLGS
jgi:hypothetical protein